MRFRMEVAYLGTRYHGWQYQHGVPTIAGALREALAALYGHEVEVIGSSRTDAGVHARGQVAIFDADDRRTPELIFRALNVHTPPDIAIQRVEACDDSFHPRHDSRGKVYCYRVHEGFRPDPLQPPTSANLRGRYDTGRMHEAAQVLLGEHDFSSFRAAGCDSRTPVKTIHGIDVRRLNANDFEIEVRGSAFLKYMVRNISGSLLEVGRGRRDAAWLQAVLEAKDRTRAAMTAPALGLTLERILYPEHPWTMERRITV